MRDSEMTKQVVTLSVYRFDPGASAPPHYDEFQIPYSKGLTVLEGLIYAYENLDSSLSFRWSCKNVQCGTCGMLVNGKAVLACERKLEVGETVQVDPFPIPVIRDVVTDFSAIEDKTVRVFSKLTPAGRPERLSPKEVSPLISLHKCLDCHICDIICPLNKGKPIIGRGSFLPSDLVQLASMVFDSREGEDRRGLAYSRRMYECLTCGVCVKACPVDIDIVNDVIERLRQDFMKMGGDPYRKLFDPKHWVERWVELNGEPFLSEAKDAYRVSEPKGEVGFFVGCLMNRRQQALAMGVIRVLNKANFDVIVPRDQKCCGQPLMRLGMVEEAKGLLRKNISLFETSGVNKVVTACPDCSFGFRSDYARLVGNEEPKPRFEILDLIQLLPEIEVNKAENIACHNPCYLSKQGIRLSEELAKKGAKIGEVVEDCCGAGGGVYFTNVNVADGIARNTLSSIKSDAILTGCPFCKEQFEKILNSKKRVKHYAELWIDHM
jgi:fumarate reductase (CoM/CoB) subunit B